MIISASRRTDIPSYYSDWFMNRIDEQFVDVRNPMFPKQISRYSLSPDIVDGIVFWTKDPAPMLGKLSRLERYSYYFQFSLTSCGKDVERSVRNKHDLIETFKQLSDIVGPDRVMWRYDPIFISNKYTLDYQIHAFREIIKELDAYTRKVTISFIDDYKFEGRSVYSDLRVKELTLELQSKVAEQLAQIAQSHGLLVDTCAEKIDLQKYGIEHARCIDSRVFEKITGQRLSRLKKSYEELEKDKSQRIECCCIESIDIGAINTCLHGCQYCYATSSRQSLAQNSKHYDPSSTLLCSTFDEAAGDRLIDNRGRGNNRDRSFKFEVDLQDKLPI